jgi:hypothetical protein
VRIGILAFLVACGGSSSMQPPALPPWDNSLPDASVMGVRRGLTPSRGIVHLHSPYSHDACDNMPRDMNGVPNEPCLQDLRHGLCVDHIDFAALTDHDDTMADEEFATLLNMRGNDQPIMDAANNVVGSRMTCDDGHEVVWSVGGENTLMPVMLQHHVPGTVAERHDLYNADTLDAMTAFRAAGGLGWIAHTEQHDIAELRTVLPDGIEVYNLHANIDPKIRGPYLGLDPTAAITAAVQFADTSDGHPEPDLALISFMTPNQPAIDRWNQLLADGKHVPVTAGSDAHENALPIMLADGERGDSYRRVLRWFANIVLVTDPHDPAQLETALGGGRLFAVFEMMGTPDGFDARATTATTTVELGGQLGVADAGTFVVDVPTVRLLDPRLPAPEIKATIVFVDAAGPHEVASGSGPQVMAPMTAAGAYRAVISIIPHHLGPYLGNLGPGYAEQELPWIYTSPIYVE